MFIYLSLSYGYVHDLSSGQNDNESDSVDSDVNIGRCICISSAFRTLEFRILDLSL